MKRMIIMLGAALLLLGGCSKLEFAAIPTTL